MVASQFRAAYDEDMMGFRSSVEGMGQDLVNILLKHLKEFLNSVCQSLGGNPEYKKFADPFCETLTKMLDSASSGAKGSMDSSGSPPTLPSLPSVGGVEMSQSSDAPQARLAPGGKGNPNATTHPPKTK
ncbi:uncharacterized protein LOC141851070 [Brevipalpus obovatus]|uniref:uncharacterized protein LOC141851070 n=1 Tax=Brevipalpus obovatus TaxID=246614 RepID=UPI003D9E5D7D